MKKNILTVVIVLGLIALGIWLGGKNKDSLNENDIVACTMEAKMCSDGSAVGRTGPHCEFAKCPDEKIVPPTEDRVAAGYVAGHVNIGPFCPVESIDHLCTIPPEAYTSREVVIYSSDKTTVNERVHLDTSGNYKVALALGNYYVQIVPAGIGAGEKKSAIVKSFETTTVNFDIDTGIR